MAGAAVTGLATVLYIGTLSHVLGLWHTLWIVVTPLLLLRQLLALRGQDKQLSPSLALLDGVVWATALWISAALLLSRFR